MAGDSCRPAGAGEFIVAPGVFEMLSAKIADRMGFKALYMTGYGISASHLGLADAGLVTYRDMVERARTIAQGTTDAAHRGRRHRLRRPAQRARDGARLRGRRRAGDPDRGPGNAEEMRPHAEPARGAARGRGQAHRGRGGSAPQQRFPRSSRAPTRAPALGMDEALRRAKAFAKAGADILFVEAPESEEEFKRVGGELAGSGEAARQHGADRQVAGGIGGETEGLRLFDRDLPERGHGCRPALRLQSSMNFILKNGRHWKIPRCPPTT